MTGVILTPFTSIKFIWTAPNVFETSAQVGSSDSLKKRWYFSCFEIVSFVISTSTGWKKKKSQNLMNIFSTFVYVG